MKKGIKLILLTFFSMLAFCLFPLQTFADGAGFTMEIVKPDNQITDATYFDLKVAPEQKQALQVRFINFEDKELKLQVSANPAFTNGNGVIEYSRYDFPKDKSAQYTLPELIKEKPQEVVLQPKEEKVVTFNMEVPKEPFKGMILGAFYALNKGDEDSTEKNQGMMIKNQYALVLGIKLQEDTETKVIPELKLNDIKPGLNNSYTTVFANLQNIMPRSFGEMTVDAKVYKKGSKEVFKHTKKENQQMAPNSNYDFPIDWENEEIKAGDYPLHLIAKAGSKTWEFDRNFTIADSEADKLNEDAVGLPEKSYTWLYILIAVLLGIILMILAFILGRRQKKDDDKEEDSSDKQ